MTKKQKIPKKSLRDKKTQKIKEINRFIMKRPYFLWWVPKSALQQVSKESVVEATLNYGDMDDVLEMIRILGVRKTNVIFQKQSRQKRCNYEPIIKNYFKLFFKRYAT